MTEKHMRRTVVNALKGLDPISVENPAYPGTPDVNYVGGWIELKQAGKWPGPGTSLRLKHFTQQQRVWLRKRCAAGGKAFLLLHVSGDWLLFEGSTAAKVLGNADRDELFEAAIASWTESLNEKELRECLCQN